MRLAGERARIKGRRRETVKITGTPRHRQEHAREEKDGRTNAEFDTIFDAPQFAPLVSMNAAIAALLVLASLVAQSNAVAQEPVTAWAEARADTWMVRQPLPNNKLQQASLLGKVRHADIQREAEVQLECRKPGPARMNLIFRSLGLAFKLDPFEGPPGVGQKQKLMEITVDHSRPQAHNFSGYYIEADQFVFSLETTAAEMRQLVSKSASSEPLLVRVSPADGKGSPLEFLFTLPADNTTAKTTVEPCLRSAGGAAHKP